MFKVECGLLNKEITGLIVLIMRMWAGDNKDEIDNCFYDLDGFTEV